MQVPREEWRMIRSVEELPSHINPVTITKLWMLYSASRPPRLRDDTGALLLHDLAAACTRAVVPPPGALCTSVRPAAQEAMQRCIEPGGDRAAECIADLPSVQDVVQAVYKAQSEAHGLQFFMHPVSWVVGNITQRSQDLRPVLQNTLSDDGDPLDENEMPPSLDEERSKWYTRNVDDLVEAVIKAAAREPDVWQSRTKFFEIVNNTKPPDIMDISGGDYEQGRGTWAAFYCRLAVNMCSLAKLGTMEFREHIGDLNAENIAVWVKRLTSMTKQAFAAPWRLELEHGIVEFKDNTETQLDPDQLLM